MVPPRWWTYVIRYDVWTMYFPMWWCHSFKIEQFRETSGQDLDPFKEPFVSSQCTSFGTYLSEAAVCKMALLSQSNVALCYISIAALLHFNPRTSTQNKENELQKFVLFIYFCQEKQSLQGCWLSRAVCCEIWAAGWGGGDHQQSMSERWEYSELVKWLLK